MQHEYEQQAETGNVHEITRLDFKGSEQDKKGM